MMRDLPGFAASCRLHTKRPSSRITRLEGLPLYAAAQAVKYFTPLANSGWNLSPGTLMKVPSVYRSE